jgi:hypothetical protein
LCLIQKKIRPVTIKPPMTRPGTNPAAKVFPENAPALSVIGVMSFFTAVSVLVEDGVAVPLGELELDAVCWALCATHTDPRHA